MRLGSSVLTLWLAGCLGAAACGYASLDGDSLPETGKSPTQSPLDTGDGGSSVDVVLPVPERETGPGPKPQSTPCAEPGLLMCFTFEGQAGDQSPSPIKASEVKDLVFVAGKEGSAVGFGPTSALRFPPNAAFELLGAGATIEAWIKRENAGAAAVVFDDDLRFSLTIDAAGKVWCRSSGGAITGASVVAVGQWAHVACVIDKGAMRAYLDGVEDGVGTGGVTSSPTATAAIGGNAPSGEPFLGAIDSFRLFGVARTPAQIAAAAAP